MRCCCREGKYKGCSAAGGCEVQLLADLIHLKKVKFEIWRGGWGIWRYSVFYVHCRFCRPPFWQTDKQTYKQTHRHTDSMCTCNCSRLGKYNMAGQLQCRLGQSSCSRSCTELHKKAPVGDWPRLAEERPLIVPDFTTWCDEWEMWPGIDVIYVTFDRWVLHNTDEWFTCWLYWTGTSTHEL